MLKIVDKSGSRGITKITDLSRMREAYDYALAATDADHMVVERFVDGREVGIDALVQNGRLLLMLPHENMSITPVTPASPSVTSARWRSPLRLHEKHAA